MIRSSSLILVCLCLTSSLGFAQGGGDLQAQILYAFQVEDTNQLESLVQSFSTRQLASGADDTLRYHLAHAWYRLGLLRSENHGHNAGQAFEGCAEQLKVLREHEPDSVEFLALSAACYSNLARVERLEGPLSRSRAADNLRSAAQIAPRNPRVLLLEARADFAGSRPESRDYARALSELESAAQIFEQTSATRIDVPGWGHAETYLDLGRVLQSRGDLLGARDWFEKALIVAPDFKAAQRQLATLQPR